MPSLSHDLSVMDHLLKHRGPDGRATWEHSRQYVGFAHRRLAIIDLDTGNQPMQDHEDLCVTYNGEIYNYLELRKELGSKNFKTQSDTEVILKAYRKWGPDCVNRFRGMFAFALWDNKNQKMFCARDRFGVKPFYYTQIGSRFYFASEAKALLPFVPKIETNLEAFKDYLAFQFCLGGKTLFQGINELLPAHLLLIANGSIQTRRYWQVYYNLDFKHPEKYFETHIRRHLVDSVDLHLRSDVPIGSYVSGGLDSSIVASLASHKLQKDLLGFTGKFGSYPDYDESRYARMLAAFDKFELQEIDMTSQDFTKHIRDCIYHLDFPAAGPGAFPQFMVSGLAAKYRKVVLSGVGGDEIFGGYARYLIAYFEQCIKAAIDGTMSSGNFIVTYESIIPNLEVLKNYKPLLREFWREGLFEEMDKRYFRLINRSILLQDEVNWQALGDYSPYETFQSIFKADNVQKESYFDSMTHFDFKTLLPALLQVEDRVSMAHGLESRVPLLDHPLVEFAATVPSNIKFKNGTMKHIFRKAVASLLPKPILDRKDKMGFPVPLSEWITGEARDFVRDTFSSRQSLGRELIDNRKVLKSLSQEPKFGRKIWGLLSLELWQQLFHDKEHYFKDLLKNKEMIT